MFLRTEHGLDQGSGTGALSFGRVLAPRPQSLADKLRERFPDFDPVPDLGSRIGSREWFRGVATCAALCTVTVMLSPGFSRPIHAASPAPLSGSDWDDARTQSISALALGSNTGAHMGATNLVEPLADTPERPIIEKTALVGRGEDFADVLLRAGLDKADATRTADLVGNAISLDDLKSGTRLDLTLGRRPAKSQPRPLEKLSFRAKFDLTLEVSRGDAGLSLTRIPIAVDHTPLRIRGRVGASLYRSARAAGVPASAVAAYIKSIANVVPMSSIVADDQFDIIVQRERAATGETQLGNLLYAGLDHGSRDVQLMRWDDDGRTSWFDPKGTSERKGAMMMPVHGRITSTFGMRYHPILHAKRMHKGLDIAAAYGTPIHAASDGVVAYAGRAGGYGNFIKLKHRGGITTEYGHMSKFAVHSGERVRRGEVIGYVGSTGLSTGAHLHWEIRKNGRAVNPQSFSFSSVERLAGSNLREFKARLRRLLSVPAAGVPGDAEEDAG
ncbi:M23 family metallopeptidase [Stakelama marina]|uniref:M23 family metallopeptidase n=1 Tax=Stakelama marina TaxID=2826939 RepID=A0A8T4IE67_9SPHN|nr:M23 family metallopeptidase [Stakelama marina]MBR0553308.1 M23 family metallopeptidase [Stakelama marina]